MLVRSTRPPAQYFSRYHQHNLADLKAALRDRLKELRDAVVGMADRDADDIVVLEGHTDAVIRDSEKYGSREVGVMTALLASHVAGSRIPSAVELAADLNEIGEAIEMFGVRRRAGINMDAF